jgi:hypothetical protein
MMKDTIAGVWAWLKLWAYLLLVTLWLGVLRIFVGAKGTGRDKDDGRDFP